MSVEEFPNAPSTLLRVPDLGPPEDGGNITDTSRREYEAFADDDYEKQFAKDTRSGQHTRQKVMHKHITSAVIATFWLIAALTMLAIFIYSWHVLMPKSFGFLADDQISTIQTILLFIITSGAVTGGVKKYLGNF